MSGPNNVPPGSLQVKSTGMHWTGGCLD